MPQQLPDLLTPVTIAEFYSSLGNAWRARFGAEPARASLLVLCSQWAEEDARGKAMHRFNCGNIKGRADGSDGHSWTFFRCNEVLGGKVVWFDPPNPACCFRAYATLDEGVADYLDELTRRFASAWPAVLAGDPADFAHRLKVARYYTADEGAYAAALVSLFHEFDRTIPLEAPLAPTGDIDNLHRLTGLADALDRGEEGLSPDSGPDSAA